MFENHKNKIKALAILLFLVIGVFEGAFLYVSSLIKPEAYKMQILEVIKAQTGQEMKINGDVRFMMFPSPKLVFSDLEMDNSASNLSSVPSFSVKKIEVYLELMSIISNQIRVSQVTLVNPTILLERADDNTIHWDWLNLKLLKVLNARNGVSVPLLISNGIFSYRDSINNNNILIEDINAYTSYGTQISLNGTMVKNDTKLNFVIDSKATDLPVNVNEFPLNISISDDYKDVITIQSVIDPTGDYPKVVGNFNINSADISKLLQMQVNDAKKNANDADMSLVVNGMWNLENDSLQMKNVTMKGLNSEGNGIASLQWNNWYPTISVDMNFAYIDYFMWKKLASMRMVKGESKKKNDFFTDDVQVDFYKDNPLPDNIEIKLNIVATKIMAGNEEWKNLKLNAVLDKGALTVNQCDIYLSGDGLLTIFGVVSQGGNGDLRFEGNMEAKGKSLREAITMFYSSGADLPDIGSGEFTVKANLYINSSQVRLFEASAMVDGTPVLGTVTAILSPQLRIETKIRLKDINFDRIRDILREKAVEVASKPKIEDDEILPHSNGFDWLKNLNTRIDATVYVDNFTFMERDGDRVSFNLYAYSGDLSISNLQLTYSDGISELNANLNVKGLVPNVSLMVNADQIDMSYFYSDEDIKNNLPPIAENGNTPSKKIKKRSGRDEITELRDMSDDTPVPVGWMDNFNGVFDITLRKFVYKNAVAEKIKFRGKIENKRLDIQKLSFVYSQAQSNIIGTLYGGKIPGINISFTMSNADIYEILQPLTTINNINGFASLSGVISTNGWSFHEWLNQMDAKLLIAARGVKVQGINIAGVSNVVDVARSSADVFNNVNNILTNGSTEFLVDGSFNIKEGELRSPGLNIRSGLVTGSITGGIKLESLMGQFSVLFRFGNLLADTTPTMIIQLSGKMDKPEIKVDTASLEDFVARRNVSK